MLKSSQAVGSLIARIRYGSTVMLPTAEFEGGGSIPGDRWLEVWDSNCWGPHSCGGVLYHSTTVCSSLPTIALYVALKDRQDVDALQKAAEEYRAAFRIRSSQFGGRLERKDGLHRFQKGATKCGYDLEYCALVHHKSCELPCTLGGACYLYGAVIPEMAAHMTLRAGRCARRWYLMILRDFRDVRVAICMAGKPRSKY